MMVIMMADDDDNDDDDDDGDDDDDEEDNDDDDDDDDDEEDNDDGDGDGGDDGDGDDGDANDNGDDRGGDVGDVSAVMMMMLMMVVMMLMMRMVVMMMMMILMMILMTGHPALTRIWPSCAPASQNPAHAQSCYYWEELEWDSKEYLVILIAAANLSQTAILVKMSSHVSILLLCWCFLGSSKDFVDLGMVMIINFLLQLGELFIRWFTLQVFHGIVVLQDGAGCLWTLLR